MPVHHKPASTKLAVTLTLEVQTRVVHVLHRVVVRQLDAIEFAVAHRVKAPLSTNATRAVANSLNVSGKIQSELNFFHPFDQLRLTIKICLPAALHSSGTLAAGTHNWSQPWHSKRCSSGRFCRPNSYLVWYLPFVYFSELNPPDVFEQNTTHCDILWLLKIVKMVGTVTLLLPVRVALLRTRCLRY